MAGLTDIREAVRERYAAAAQRASSSEGCCGSSVGFSDEFGSALYGVEAGEAPQEAVAASLGCGVPTAVADLHPREIVLDLGSGAGADLISAEFVKGYLEDIPLPDASVDVVISNCVINLAADKRVVLAEAARVLRPGGRFAVSDVIADDDMDDATRADMQRWTGCIAGALTESEFRAALAAAGLIDVEIQPTHRVHAHASSAVIRARAPR